MEQVQLGAKQASVKYMYNFVSSLLCTRSKYKDKCHYSLETTNI